ncbi:MAG: hypothetical protein QXQ18_00360 [Candidatus Aenigmatarchaeota archaeon]
MAVFGGLVDLGVAILLVAALAEYFKFRGKADKGFSWLAVSGVFFVFAGTFGTATTLGSYIGSAAWGGLGQLFEVLGWLFALVGTIFVAYQTLVER